MDSCSHDNLKDDDVQSFLLWIELHNNSNKNALDLSSCMNMNRHKRQVEIKNSQDALVLFIPSRYKFTATAVQHIPCCLFSSRVTNLLSFLDLSIDFRSLKVQEEKEQEIFLSSWFRFFLFHLKGLWYPTPLSPELQLSCEGGFLLLLCCCWIPWVLWEPYIQKLVNTNVKSHRKLNSWIEFHSSKQTDTSRGFYDSVFTPRICLEFSCHDCFISVRFLM